jgi:inner membrane protein
MDPLTQGVVGVTAAQLVSERKHKVAAAAIGFFSGMAADLDVLISSSEDPLLFLEFHRHFTHSLVFIPIGALLCTLAFRLVFRSWFKRNNLSFKTTYLFSIAGYATHALLDVCTTYGTQLFWPFTDMRVTWNTVSVIDPLFTVPLMILVFTAVYKRSSKLAWIGTCYAFLYLGLGGLQNKRAESVAQELALSRGHTPLNLGVKPSMANLIVWKSVYEYQGRYYVDAIRVFANTKVYQGTSVAKLDLGTHFSWLVASSQQAKDVERFRWFSNQYLGLDPSNSNRIIDIRYSMIPNEVTGMWGIVLSDKKGEKEHVEWTTNRPKGKQATQKIRQLWGMINGE